MVPEWVKIAGAMFLPNFGAAVGQRLTRKAYKRDLWYKALKKPFFCPPAWVFGPTWIGLYSSMGYASYLIWHDGGGFKGAAATPLALYSTQLAMNWAWGHIFFGAKMVGLTATERQSTGFCLTSLSRLDVIAYAALTAEVEMIALLGAATATAVTFKPINATAYRLMLPYMVWLAFLGVSIFEIWRLNRRRYSDEERKDG